MIKHKRKNKKNKIKLLSKKGVKVYGDNKCANCRIINNSNWKYLNSNKGEVYLCDMCKDSVFIEASGYGKSVRVISTDFESNKRKH